MLAANLIFGANYSIVKYVTPGFVKPFALNVVRIVVSVALLWSLYLMKPSSPGIQKRHVGRFVLCAITGVAINQLLFIKGLSLTTSIHAALLTLATPIFITLIAAWLLKEGLGLYKIGGLLIGVAGALLLLAVKERTGDAANILLGDVYILINAISYAFYMVLVRPLMLEYRPVHVIRWVFTIGMFMIVPFGYTEFVQTDWTALTTPAWISLAFVVVGATFLAYLFNIYGIKEIGASATGTYIYTQPLFAALVAIFFLGEEFTLKKVIAAVLIFTGVYLVNLARNKNGDTQIKRQA